MLERIAVDEFDFPRLIAYYSKVVANCLRYDGKDWRWALYQARLERVQELSVKTTLSRPDIDYLSARQAVVGAFR